MAAHPPCDPAGATICYAPSLRLERNLRRPFVRKDFPPWPCLVRCPVSPTRCCSALFSAPPPHFSRRKPKPRPESSAALSPIRGAAARRRHGYAAQPGDQRLADPYHQPARRVCRHAASGGHLRRGRPGSRIPRETSGTSVAVALGETVEINFALAPQVVQLQEITVAAEPARGRHQVGIGSTRLGVEAVEGLPNNGRNIFNFTTLTPERRHRAGPRRRRDQHRRPARHPQQRLGGRRRLQQPVLRRAARRPAAGLHLQPRRGAGLRGRGRRRQRGVRPVRRRVRQHHHQVGHQRVPRLGALLRQVRRALGRLHPHLPGRRHDRLHPRLQPAPVRRHARRADGAGPGVLLPGLRPAGVQRDQADRPARPRSTRRWWPSPTPRSAARSQDDFGPISRTNDANALLGQARFPAEPEAQRLAQVQLHLLPPGERHLRRGLLGPERQRAGDGTTPTR